LPLAAPEGEAAKKIRRETAGERAQLLSIYRGDKTFANSGLRAGFGLDGFIREENLKSTGYRSFYQPYYLNERDLVRLCPGFTLRSWDIPALLEDELGRAPVATKRDPKALDRITKARQAFSVRSVRQGGFEGFVSSDGRACLRHRLDVGLEELIVVNEDGLYEVYPELGLAALRSRSRFADAWLEER